MPFLKPFTAAHLQLVPLFINVIAVIKSILFIEDVAIAFVQDVGILTLKNGLKKHLAD